MEGAAGSSYVTVLVQVYGRIAANGKPWYALRQVTLRRVNDVDGSTAEQRRWHIESIGAYTPPPSDEGAGGQPISMTDGMAQNGKKK